MLCTVCEIRIYYLLTYTDHTVYGTVCAVSALMMSAVVAVVCTSAYIKCKHKGVTDPPCSRLRSLIRRLF